MTIRRVHPFTIFLSFLIGILFFGALSYTCSFFHGFFLGFILPLQWIASLLSDYQIQGFGFKGWELAGFVIGIIALLDCIRRKGVFTLTLSVTKDSIRYEQRIL